MRRAYWLILLGIPALAVAIALVDCATGARRRCEQRGGHLRAFDCEPAVTHCATDGHGQRSCTSTQRCDWRCVDDPRPAPPLADDAGMP